MNKFTYSLLFLFFTSFAFSQVSFEKGYYITESGETVECLIKNLGWKNNPTEFEYKLVDTDSPKTASIKTVQEFGLGESLKFIRAKVTIDYSPKKNLNISSLSKQREPENREETVFLQVLIDGEASLYKYETDLFTRFFFSLDENQITPLVYKRYIVDQDKIKTNSYFKQQLFLSLTCNDMNSKRFQNLSYSETSLIRLFKDYGKCRNIQLTNLSSEKKKGSIHLHLRPRVQNYPQFNVDYIFLRLFEFRLGNTQNFGLGLDFEYILPSNKNKWSITFEPTFLSYKNNGMATITYSGNTATFTAEVKKTWIKIPVGARHYAFINDKSSLFFAVYYGFEVNLESKIDIYRNIDGSIVQSSSENYWGGALNFGVGYQFLNKFSVEARYNGKSDVLKYVDGGIVSSGFQSGLTSLVLGYRLF